MKITSIIFILLGLLSSVAFAETTAGTIKGTVKATSVSQSTMIAGAKLTLTNNASPGQPYRTETNEAGEFIFSNLPAGQYILLAESAGLTSVSKTIKLDSGAVLTVDIDLTILVGETVNVRIQEGLLSTSESSVSNVIRAETLKLEPFRDDNFQNSIALTPGVVRDGKNNNYLKGTRTGQSGYNVNGADVTDPATGNIAFEIPLEAASVVEVEENPYSSEYGHFTGGITNLQTKGGENKFKFSAARLFPTFKGVFSTKVDSFRPRVTFSGPIIKDKLYFLQSFEYRFRRDKVTSLPKDLNRITTESFNAFTQFDWNINKSNILKFNFALFPGRVRNLGLDTFNTAESSPNYKQRGDLLSISEQSIFRNSSFLSSSISRKTFDVDVFAKSTLPFELTPEINRGGYFADTRRQTERWQWNETYYFRPLKAFGDHLLKTGVELFQTNIHGRLNFSPINILRLDGTLAQRIDFQSGSPFVQTFNNIDFFVQDHWTIDPKIALDYGIRFGRDGVTGLNNIAPRFSILYSPFKNGRTVIRSGVGIFYDRSSPISGLYEVESIGDTDSFLPNLQQMPVRIVTNYATDGTTIIGVPIAYEPQILGNLKTPQSIRWSFQIDQGITKELNVRFGYLNRRLTNDLTFEPSVLPNNSASLLLNSSGRSNYSEYQFVATYNRSKFGQWNASYVFSRANGDLNTIDKIYSDTPSFVLRPNQYGPLSFDVRHRFLLYGQLDTKHDIRIAPLFEVRSGFPYSAVDESLNFIGNRNQAGRFPTYMSLDVQVTKGFKLPYLDNKKIRIGVALFNLTNHFNPRDVQMNFTSPNYGNFYNSLGTEIKAKFDFDF